MEKICSFRWRPEGKPRQEDAYWWDGKFILLSRAGGEPQIKWDGLHLVDGASVLAQLYRQVKMKGYERLMPHTQKLYDFLNARIGRKPHGT